MAKVFIAINQGKLDSDCRNANISMKEKDGYSTSIRLEKNGLTHSALYGAKEMWARHEEFRDEDYECSTPGLMGMAKLQQICNIFGLNPNDYKIYPITKNEVVEVVKETISDEKLDEVIMNINKLGNILMQSMEYQKECMNYLASMNAKYNKPSAYIPHKK